MTENRRYIVFHGRFQPFHNGHSSILDYLTLNTDYEIIIGIVNPDPWEVWPGDSRDYLSFHPSTNPLTYWDRYVMISEIIRKRKMMGRIKGIIPMPRPSVNMEQAKRFIPFDDSYFLYIIRWGDRRVEEKMRQVISMGGVEYTIQEGCLPIDIRPINSILIRDLMVLDDNTWKEFIPVENHELYYEMDIIGRFVHGVRKKEALKNIKQFIDVNPFELWSKKYLDKYINHSEAMDNDDKYKPDIIGAIAESIFEYFPAFKGLLRLRDQRHQHEFEYKIISEIKNTNLTTINEVKTLISSYSDQYELLNNVLIKEVFARALLEYKAFGKFNTEQIMTNIEGLKDEWFGGNKEKNDDQYLSALLSYYDTNIENLLLLLKDCGFDISQVIGSSPKAKVRSVLQNIKKLSPESIYRVTQKIHNEHPEDPLFKRVYMFAKDFIPISQ